jgi:hypothetical protein
MRQKYNTKALPPPESRPVSEFIREPVKEWSTLPITEERAQELVDLLTDDLNDHTTDAIIELIAGIMPQASPDDETESDRWQRFIAGSAAILHAFRHSSRCQNALGDHIIHLKIGKIKEKESEGER